MTDTNEGAPRPPFIDEAEAAQRFNQILTEVREFRMRLGQSALAASSEDILGPLAESLSRETERIGEYVQDFEEKPKFGDEDSYWNVFRYFCVEDNRGRVRSLDEIWQHLALTFDMSAETMESLAETLDEWTDDIETDAKVKYRATGWFKRVEDGYVFYEDIAKRPAKKTVARKPATKASEQPRKVLLESEDTIESNVESLEAEATNDVPLDKLLLDVVDGHGGRMKQAELVKAVIAKQSGLGRDDVYDAINIMAENGKIIKFKPRRGGPTHIAINADQVAANYENAINVAEESPETESVNKDLAEELLRALTGRYQKPGQMMATSQLVNSLEVRGNKVNIRELNAVARALKDAGLLHTDTGSPLRGKGKAKSRAKSRQTFRVGMKTSEMLTLARSIVQNGNLDDYIPNA